VLLSLAPEGTGVIGRRRSTCGHDFGGIQNVLTKSIGTTNPHNVVKATFEALKKLKNRQTLRLCAARRCRSCKKIW